MKLPKWLRPAEAPTPDLEAQHAAAKEALSTAEAATAAAQDSFDADPTAERSLLAARDAERLAAEHFARAERLLAAARERDEQARIADLRRECTLQESKIAELVETAKTVLVDAEIEALERVADARAARLAHRDLLRAERRELMLLRSKLGQMPPVTHIQSDPDTVSFVGVAERLERLAADTDPSDPRRSLLLALRPGHDDYHHHHLPTLSAAE